MERGRVALLGLEAPDEPRGGVRERVHGVEEGHEIGDERRIDGRHEAADVELGEVIRRRSKAFDIHRHMLLSR